MSSETSDPGARMLRRRSLLGAGSGALLTQISRPARAQNSTYPNKPIRLLVGYPPGGGMDVMARLLAPRLGAVLGQPIVIDNRTGAAGVIAAAAVAKASPDGYTLMLGDTSTLIAPFMQPNLPFDPLTSFAPVAGLFKLPLVIVAHNAFPAKTPRELITVLKAAPGRYAYATPGVGTVQHLAFEMFKAQTGTFVTHVPYRGANQIVPDVMSGQVPLAVVSVAAASAQVKAGNLRALALTAQEKLPGAEAIPSLAEALANFDAAPCVFLFAPSKTPAAVTEQLADACEVVMRDASLPASAANLGALTAFLRPAALSMLLAEDSNRWGKLIRDQKIAAE